MHQTYGLVLAGALALACGGNTKATTNPSTSSDSSTGGANTSGASAAGGSSATDGSSTGSASVTDASTVGGTGGDAPTGIGGSFITTAGGEPAAGGSGGEASDVGGAGAAGVCDEPMFWRRVTRVLNGGLGSCGPTVCNRGIVPAGSVMFDAEGSVSGFTGLNEETAQKLMQEFEGGHWSCLSDQTIEFCCFAR